MTLSLYRDAELYELAFAHGDVEAEVDALIAWYGRHGADAPRRASPARALELGAGPAAHAIQLAARGVDVTALDGAPAMRALARRRARAAGVRLQVVDGDLAAVDATPAPVDLAFCVGDTAAHLLDLDALVRHFASVAQTLSRHAVYVMETSHPADFMSATPRTLPRWQSTRRGTRARVRWSRARDGLDPITQLDRVTLTIAASGPDGERRVRHELTLRRWTADELTAAARLAGLEVVARYGDYDGRSPEDAGAAALITVLRPLL